MTPSSPPGSADGATGRGEAIDVVLDLLACPHCGSPFVRADRTVRCGSGHSFDLARQGHLNLLGRAPPTNADSAAMVASRDRFLTGGAYAGLADTLAEVTATLDPRPATVVEVGAGTGYYLSRVVEAVDGRGLALDVSPAAARRAARTSPRIGSVVADAWCPLPVRGGVVDLIVSVFAPRNPAEFARVLAPRGGVVIAAPLPDHLNELRTELGLLSIETDKQARIEASMTAGFVPAGTRICRYAVELAPSALADLVLMGPNAFHQERAAVLDRLANRSTVTVAVAVAVEVTAWRRRAA